ncbi:transcription/translation regulatory transformer protein RfaH [Spiribacter roseus]|uniref:transcription/translation regulatory transformer protein RfaH n=1 Tax=Spiribacter roseus TaxID=1855875 RepID=UPI00132F68C9|nr:transcription/translation regulatory transformer protein RfaH [Spiribacter roseus]KAF0284013.1 NusG antitermination factor [Spiribacter roseus]
MKRWYAIYCKPREDERAELHLDHQAFEVFRPKHRVRRKRRGAMTTLIESLFPRYLFIHLDDVSQNWAPIRSTRGVAGMVRWGDHVPPVPQPVIDCLRRNVDEVGCIPTPQADYQKGDRLVIQEGAFAGHEGLFYGRRGEDRVMLLLEVMKQPQTMVFPEASVARG